MAENKMRKLREMEYDLGRAGGRYVQEHIHELTELAIEVGRQDFALRLLDEIYQIDIYGTDEYEHGANFAIGEVVDIIRRLAGDSDGRTDVIS